MRIYTTLLCIGLTLPALAANAADSLIKIETSTRETPARKIDNTASAPLPEEKGQDDVIRILDAVRDRVCDIDDYTAVVSLQERYGQELGPTLTTQVKWARPYRIYIKNIEEPKLGRELLFVRGKNGEELLAHKGSFPDITLSIDPYGSLASDCNHHPITEASIHVIFEVMDRNFRLAHQRLEGEIRVAGSEMLGERPCKKIEARFVKGGWFHTMKEDETLWDVAHRYGKNMYQILHHNQDKGWEEADDPSAGDQVYIPRYYASRMEVWIDEELNLPIKAQAFDHFGQLYEVFEFRDMRVNTGLTEKDFDEDNPDYDF